MCQYYKKITEAKVKVYDLTQRTMQSLENLALVYATFEQAVTNMEVEFSEEDLLLADVRAAMRGHAEAQQHQERLQVEQKNSRDSLDTAFMELDNCRDLHDAVCRGLEDAGMKTTGCFLIRQCVFGVTGAKTFHN